MSLLTWTTPSLLHQLFVIFIIALDKLYRSAFYICKIKSLGFHSSGRMDGQILLLICSQRCGCPTRRTSSFLLSSCTLTADPSCTYNISRNHYKLFGFIFLALWINCIWTLDLSQLWRSVCDTLEHKLICLIIDWLSVGQIIGDYFWHFFVHMGICH